VHTGSLRTRGNEKAEKKDALFCVLRGVKKSLGVIIRGYEELTVLDSPT